MRRLPAGVAISVIVHAAVLAYIALCVLPGARQDAPVVRAVPRVTPPSVSTPPELEVELLDDAPLTAVPPLAPPAVPPPAVALPRTPHVATPLTPSPLADAAIASAPAVHADATEPPAAPATGAPAVDLPAGTAAPPAPATSLLAMRHGEPPGVAMPAGLAGELAPVQRDPKVDAGRLDHDGAGDTVDQGVFDAKIAPDGTVKLTDKHSASVAIAGKQLLDDYRKSDNTLGGPRGDPSLAGSYQPAPGTAINLGASSSINAVPGTASMSHNLDKNGTTIVAPLLSGTFDASDALMRNHGMDPYFSRKLQFLDATRDRRAQLGNHNRNDQLAHAARLMQRNLDALWTDPRLDLAAKKRALFELWDECAEDGDTLLVNGAGSARQRVIGFIRSHVPAGSAGAYTRSELAELARQQQSKAVFQPYDE